MRDLNSGSFTKPSGKVIDLDVAFKILGLPNYTLQTPSSGKVIVWAQNVSTPYYIAGGQLYTYAAV